MTHASPEQAAAASEWPRDPRWIDLDRAATSPLHPRVRSAMESWWSSAGTNPSSRHAAGFAAQAAVESSARSIARRLGAAEDARVVFTSGGTEANNLAVLGAARAARRRRHIVLSALEHPCVREAASALARDGFEVDTVPCEKNGVVAAGAMLARCRADTALVALMAVNNEIGAIEPVAELGSALRARCPDAHFHVDAIQAIARVPVSFDDWSCDSLALGSHKLGGPRSSGALLLRAGRRLEPLLLGGGQQDGLRPGTMDVASAVGLSCAVELAVERRAERERFGRAYARDLLAALRETCGEVHEWVLAEHRVADILALRFPAVPAENLMHRLASDGILVSLGAACRAAKGTPAQALTALGASIEEARSTLRLSFDPALEIAPRALAERFARAIAELRAIAR